MPSDESKGSQLDAIGSLAQLNLTIPQRQLVFRDIPVMQTESAAEAS